MGSHLLGSVELGGTKAVVAVARDPLQPLMRERIPTRDPEATLSDIVAFFLQAAAEHGAVEALGIASFGPIDIRRGSQDWGRMGRTPKPGWTGADVAGRLERELDCPVALDTDVNGAGLAEARWGAGRDLDIAYLTVGTGIGGGLIIGGKPVHGAMHPEIGHVRLRRHSDDPFPGRCPFHGDCAEGLASGPAIMDRFSTTLEGLGPDHPFRRILADYLGQLCATLALVACPERIVIGGGVMAPGELHAEVERAAADWLAFYVPLPKPFIVPPALGEDAGLIGGFGLAQDRLHAGARSS